MKQILKYCVVLSIAISATIHTNAQVSVGLSITIAPPALPLYTQPYCPGDGYLWIPGYWAYSDDGYFWVPGTWILPPEYGLLWTPGYWGITGGYCGWHEGYWGRHVGYYGGINYGYGYGGRGYYGGEWRGNTFAYNTAVTNVNTTVVHNTYINKTVNNENTIVSNKRASFNGQGGVIAAPTEQEKLASRESHLKPTSSQIAHESSAGSNKNQFASVNHGHPQNLAETSVHNNQAGNDKNNTRQKTVALNQHEPVQKSQKVANVKRNNQESIHNQRELPNSNQTAIKHDRISARNHGTQSESNPNKTRNNQANAQPQRMTAQHQPSQKRPQMPARSGRENAGDRGKNREK